MSYPHRIRLRGPWECEPLARIPANDAPLPAPLRMTLPTCWSQGGLKGFAGRVRFRRRFGVPARLDAFERLWLTCAGVETTADVWLDGCFLGRSKGAFEYEITSLLRVRNELIVEVEGSAERGGIGGEVALEVRCTAYLQGIEARSEGEGVSTRLHISGRVVGTAERPLDLYVLLDGSTVAYTTIEATPEGRPFQLTTEELGPERRRNNGPHLLRVDLVNAASMWYQFEQILALSQSERPSAADRGGAGD